MEVLLERSGRVSAVPRVHYLRHELDVPEGVTRLRAVLRYRKERLCQLFLSVFGPGGYRGTRMDPAAVGEVVLELELGEAGAGPGALAGPIEAGRWWVQIDVERTDETTDYELRVEAEREPTTAGPVLSPAPDNGRPAAGWYRGELHAHTHHSDGKPSVAALVAAARRYGLDFLALTDHFTHAGWAELESLAGPDLAVLKGIELTGHRGHANMHGLAGWVDPFVDEPGSGWTVNDAARAARAQGGLFGVNHAFSGDLGWRYHEFDWSLCDLFEIYHHLEGPNNPHQLATWDGLLRAGHRITGVAGTDSHDPHVGRHRLGSVFTYVQAEALGPDAILAGLRAGRAYVSFGPTLLGFVAESEGGRAGMGGRLAAGSSVRLEVELGGLEFPSRLFVMKNGLYHAHRDLPAAGSGPLRLAIEDDAPTAGYYRLELYARPVQPAWHTGREWDQTLLLSNPIYVSTGPER